MSYFLFVYCMHVGSCLPVASFPLEFFVMTTLDETVVGVLAAMTTPINTNEFIGVCNLNNNSTKPKTKKGMMIRLIICTSKCSRTRSNVCVKIFVRSESPEIKKMMITAPVTSGCQLDHVNNQIACIFTPFDRPFCMNVAAFSGNIGCRPCN